MLNQVNTAFVTLFSGKWSVQEGFYEATRELPLTDVEIETPICKTTVKELEGKKMAVVPILRAGLGMVEGMLAMIPAAKIGHIGSVTNTSRLAMSDGSLQ